MGWDQIMLVVLPVALGLLLLSAGIEDVRIREIADWKNAAIALLAPAWWWATGLEPWPDIAVQMGVAAGVFGLFMAVFAMGAMGGGDVKMIGALALWFPVAVLSRLLVTMSLVGGAITVAFLVERRWARWRRGGDGREIEVPYGVAIAVAGLLALGEPVLNQMAGS
ncbi:prepilin peptidase [uncultured Sphingomonas sp.]|uniref:A24 family peptidase n=1 Tax=uncultured Sphingomonas sp. TaxID=158754 RepID=UPI0035CA088C